jgi:hypothetical protein
MGLVQKVIERLERFPDAQRIRSSAGVVEEPTDDSDRAEGLSRSYGAEICRLALITLPPTSPLTAKPDSE